MKWLPAATIDQFIAECLGDRSTPQKLTEHNHVFLSVVKRTQTAIKRSKSTPAAPPTEILHMNAESMGIHDAMDKYKVYSLGKVSILSFFFFQF